MPETLSEEQVASCKKAFAGALKEGSSTIGLDEMRDIVKALGFVDAQDEEVSALFKESDADGSGGIDEAEFVELMKKLQAKAGGRSLFDGASSFFSSVKMPSMNEVKLPSFAAPSAPELSEEQVAACKKAFAGALKEGSSTIGLTQVGEIVKAVGVEAKEEEVVALFKESDADGSGAIDETEFLELVKKVQAKAGGRSLFDGASSFFGPSKFSFSLSLIHI